MESALESVLECRDAPSTAEAAADEKLAIQKSCFTKWTNYWLRSGPTHHLYSATDWTSITFLALLDQINELFHFLNSWYN